MKDAVLISIHRKFVEKIASGEKTLEIRKRFPRIGKTFKCYVYETKRNGGRGAVVMEFECTSFVYLVPTTWPADFVKQVAKAACVELQDLLKYSGGHEIYAWNIRNVKVYDKPKDPVDFGVNRIPQSWCYVEEVL